MIKFFRKIRQNLLTENKVSKYLLYAIGEIVLVVIGILIALQVNNWNEFRKLRVKNFENLYSLSQELKANQEVLKVNIERVKEKTRLGLNMLDSINSDVIPEEMRNTYLLEKIGRLGPLRLQQLTTAAFDEIINSGSYSTIISSDVKEFLLSYKGQLDNVKATMDRFEDNFQNIELPYLTKHFSILDMLTNRNDVINNEDVKLLGESIPNFKRDEYYFSHNQQAFFNNREFSSMGTNRYFDLRAVLKGLINLNTSIDNLLETIDKELDI